METSNETGRTLPILFRGPLVRAILDGRKTCTRRLRGLDVVNVAPDDWEPDDGDGPRTVGLFWNDGDEVYVHPPCDPGDLLWVRETHAWADHLFAEEREDPCVVAYRADETVRTFYDPTEPGGSPIYPGPVAWDRMRWRPSIHMPRWASRLTLRVTEVRVERLQDISEEGARAEGCGPADLTRCAVPTVRDAFRRLWDDLASKGTTWADNPWVWVIGFEVVR